METSSRKIKSTYIYDKGIYLIKSFLYSLIFLISSQSLISQNVKSLDSLEILVESTTRYLNRDIKDSRGFQNISILDSSYENIPDSPLKAKAARNLGQYFQSIFSYKVAQKYFISAIETYSKYNIWKEVVDTQKELAINYRLNGQLDKMEPLLEHSLDICIRENLGDRVLVPLMELTIYNSYDTDNYEKAIDWGHKFLDSVAYYNLKVKNDSIFEYRRDLESQIINIELAKSYIATNSYNDQILPRLNKAHSFFTSRQDHEKLARVYEQFFKYYLKSDNIDKVNEYYQKQKDQQTIRQDLERQRLKEMPSYIENAHRVESDLKLSLFKNKQLSELNNIYALALIIILSLISLGIFFYIHYIREKKLLTKKIKNIQSQINADLHDNFGNNLAALATSKNVLNEILSEHQYPDHPLLTKFLKIIEIRLSDLNDDIQDLIWANKKGNNQLIKIIKRINHLSTKFSTLNDIEVRFHYFVEKNYETPSLWNRQLLLIIKEFLHNSLKHSQSKIMEINITSKKYRFSLTCRDYGVGFDYNKLKRKSGLMNMQKRAQSINCDLKIDSSERGTIISLIGVVPTARPFTWGSFIGPPKKVKKFRFTFNKEVKHSKYRQVQSLQIKKEV